MQLSANLSFLFTEQPFLERFAAAAAVGFRGVEYMFPYAYPAEKLRAHLDAHGLQQVLFNLPAGDWDAGERGIACHPGRQYDFRPGVELAIAYAKALGCPRLNCLAGLRPATASEAECFATMRANLAFAADATAAAGIGLLIEPINSRVDMPGFWLDTPEKAMRLIEAVGHPNLGLQFDVYHAHIMGGDVVRRLLAVVPAVQHVQIADHPGRHEPGSGEIEYPFVLDQLDAAGYNGWVGCEYRPAGETLAGLAWARRWLSPKT
jgi:hydroxypyruvate isomerase